MNDTFSAIYAAVCLHNVECSGMSWGGFNLLGDRVSIDEVVRLISCEARLIALEGRIKAAGIKI